MSMRKLTLIGITTVAILVGALSGCRYLVSEPYPAFVVSEVPPSRLPGAVRDAFTSSYPDIAPERVQARSFKRKVDLYRVFFRTRGGELTNAVFTCSGTQTSVPGSFP